jgi:sugar phosphate isomerase/epimerase
VGEAQGVDFPAVMRALGEIGYDRVVTCCPGEPAYEGEDAISESRRSAAMREYVRSIGF